MRLFICLLILACATDANAQIVQLRITTVKTVNCGNGQCQQVTETITGSGTLIAVGPEYKPGKSLVLSAGHLFRGNVTEVLVFNKTARLIAREETVDSDLSLIEVDHAYPESSSVLDGVSIVGSRATVIGWGGETARGAAAISGVIEAPDRICARVELGDSGGPVFTKGGICGVVSSRTVFESRPVCFFTPQIHIRRFVEKHRCSPFVYRSRVRIVAHETAPPPPIDEPPPRLVNPPPEPPPRPITPTPIGDRSPQGERGPQGETGLQGPKGDKGNDGMPANPKEVTELKAAVADLTIIVSNLKQRIDTLQQPVDSSDTIRKIQQEIAAMKSIKTPIQVMVSDGKIFSQDTISLQHDANNDGIGEPIVIRLIQRQQPQPK